MTSAAPASVNAPDAAAVPTVGLVGWRGMVGSVLLQRMAEEGDFARVHPVFFSTSNAGGPAPVRRFLPELIQLIWDRKIDPGKVFDLTLPLEQAADGYRAMDERRATKVLLTV